MLLFITVPALLVHLDNSISKHHMLLFIMHIINNFVHFFIISKHRMLLFILKRFFMCGLITDFKTSYVTVYPILYAYSLSFVQISKHRMLLFIAVDRMQRTWTLEYFKTSYVTVYHDECKEHEETHVYFKTSYVTVYQKLDGLYMCW